MYEYCSVTIKKYSKYTIPSLAPNGFYSMLEPPQIDKWQHLSTNCTLQFRVLLMDLGQVVIHIVLNNSTLLENIKLPLGNNQDMIQFSCKCPIISCKYISEEFGPKMLRRFQINLPNEIDFNKTIVSLKNLNFILRTAKTSIARNMITNQVLDIKNSKKADFTESTNVSGYKNSNAQFQTQNMIMDFSQRYQEEPEREASIHPNNILTHKNFPIAQPSWPKTDLSAGHSSQDLNTPLTTQAVSSWPEPLNVQLPEASQILPKITGCFPNIVNQKKNIDPIVDLASSRKNISERATTLLDVHTPKEQTEKDVQVQSSTVLATTPPKICGLDKENPTAQNANIMTKVDNKLDGSQRSKNANTPCRNEEPILNGLFNGTKEKTYLDEGTSLSVKNVNMNASRKISKRLIKKKLKDEDFIKWVCINL